MFLYLTGIAKVKKTLARCTYIIIQAQYLYTSLEYKRESPIASSHTEPIISLLQGLHALKERILQELRIALDKLPHPRNLRFLAQALALDLALAPNVPESPARRRSASSAWTLRSTRPHCESCRARTGYSRRASGSTSRCLVSRVLCSARWKRACVRRLKALLWG